MLKGKTSKLQKETTTSRKKQLTFVAGELNKLDDVKCGEVACRAASPAIKPILSLYYHCPWKQLFFCCCCFPHFHFFSSSKHSRCWCYESFHTFVEITVFQWIIFKSFEDPICIIIIDLLLFFFLMLAFHVFKHCIKLSDRMWSKLNKEYLDALYKHRFIFTRENKKVPIQTTKIDGEIQTLEKKELTTKQWTKGETIFF